MLRLQRRHRLLHRVAGAELRHLAHALRVGQAAGSDRGFHRLGAVAGDDHRVRRPQPGGGIQNMLQ